MIVDEDVYLEHFGVKGMRWGIRNDHPGGVSGHVNRQAKNDAQEFARAKAFYGDGAGTRRKLIKATVEGKSQRIPGYKQAFDHHLNAQDPSKHAAKAVAERHRTDTKNTAKKTTKAVARRVTGELGTSAAFVALAAGGYQFAKSPRGQAVMKKAASKVGDSSDTVKRFINAQKIKKFM